MNSKMNLDQLLSETPSHARTRVQRELDWFHPREQPLVLYGAGTLGLLTLAKLRKVGIEPAAFADDTPEKQGHFLLDVPILSPSDAAKRVGPSSLFVVTILNPQLSFLNAKARLESITRSQAISFLTLFWKFPEVFLPYSQFEMPERLLTKANKIRAAFDLWADEESKQQFVGHLRFRLLLDHDSLPPNNRQGYFPDLLSLPAHTVFVDCGAFDGDSIREFLAHQHNNFASIYAFEPDETNFRRLQSFINGLPPMISEKIVIHNAAVGETRSRVAFNATGNMSAALTSKGASMVDVVPLDEVIEPDNNPIFLKLDVEGAEWQALKGGQELIERHAPTIAISIYHQPDDLWDLPLYISRLNPRYKLFLRTQGEDGMDVICYAARL
ncbi:MAG TPA: FkbM family methyltransferase [Pyrinomonadaceae bacterium]|nr:FkbM family methyltransferase [Pyrinomonadaceae bacterium]